jgi:DNA invertase Pin-like site-specific DNA recombinase
MRDEALSAHHQEHIKSGALGVFLAVVRDGKTPPGSILVVEELDRRSRATLMVALTQLVEIVSAGLTVVTALDGQAHDSESFKKDPSKLLISLSITIRAQTEN